MSNLSIRALTRYPDADWNAYVDTHPEGSVFHLSEWGAVYAELTWTEPHFLVAHDGQRLVGVLPLGLVRCGFGGSALVSAPYCVEAGALADDAAIAARLEAAALALARETRVTRLELRGLHPDGAAAGDEVSFAVFRRALSEHDDDNLKAIPRKQRAMIRKGEAAGLGFVADDDLEAFYAMYARGVRDLGTPVYADALFRALARHLGECMAIHAVRHGEVTVARVMSFYYKSRVMPYYAGALPQARALKAYDYLYWALMRDAVAQGYREFDFGRSQLGSGAAAFKKNWGFSATPLHYRITSADGETVAGLDPDSAFNRLARRAWSRTPLAIANRLGPYLARRLY